MVTSSKLFAWSSSLRLLESLLSLRQFSLSRSPVSGRWKLFSGCSPCVGYFTRRAIVQKWSVSTVTDKNNMNRHFDSDSTARSAATSKALSLSVSCFVILYLFDFTSGVVFATGGSGTGGNLWLTLLLPLIYAACIFISVFLFRSVSSRLLKRAETEDGDCEFRGSGKIAE